MTSQTWRAALNWTMAVLIAAVFLAAGVWKALDPRGVAVMLTQLKVPQSLSVALAVCLAIAETFTGVLLLVPRLRKWGSAAGALLLIAFMVYIGIHYTELRGADCSCFPWLKRTVGPGFFVGDAIMLLLAIGAGITAPAAASVRWATAVFAAVAVFAFASFGVASTRQHGVRAPVYRHVRKRPANLSFQRQSLRIFLQSSVHALPRCGPAPGRAELGRYAVRGSSH